MPFCQLKNNLLRKYSALYARLLTPQYKVIALSAALLTVFYNFSFFTKLLEVFPLNKENVLFLIATGIVLFLAIYMFFALLAGKYTTKPLLILSFLTASVCGFFMSNYGVVIDASMLQNVAETDPEEVHGLLSFSLLLYVIFLGVLPSFLIWKWKIHYQNLKRELASKVAVMVLCLVVSIIVMAMFSGNFISFFREYKPVRYYTNPTYPFYSTGKYFAGIYMKKTYPDYPAAISPDAQKIHSVNVSMNDEPYSKLVIFVVGEAARADHFQLNGYSRETNPQLSKIKNVISFTQMASCGTSTAASVPCMFSIYGRDSFKADDIYTHENVLNVLKRVGVNILWRDNNSSSKGVAAHVAYEDFHHPSTNPDCDGDECRDTGMLVTLQDYINRHPKQDILIVLHQFGSHGPEYYKRYPAEFEHFKPVCKTNKLGNCTQQEIINAYDNTIRYTDNFLARVIALLKQNDERFETTMMYMSDHGESLGEGGLYLHGLPYAIAPDVQKHIATIVWNGKNSEVSQEILLENKDKHYSHDNLYCTLLSLFDVDTKDCSSEKDMFDTLQTVKYNTVQPTYN